MHKSACADETKESESVLQQPSSNIKQLSHRELLERIDPPISEQNNTTQKELQEIEQNHAASCQYFYDFYLKMLLYNLYRENNRENFDMSGLEQLQWAVETNKNSYKVGEPIGFRLSLKNISEKDITVMYPLLFDGFIGH